MTPAQRLLKEAQNLVEAEKQPLSQDAQLRKDAEIFKEATIMVFSALLATLADDIEFSLRPLNPTEVRLIQMAHDDARAEFFSGLSEDLLCHILSEAAQPNNNQ